MRTLTQIHPAAGGDPSRSHAALARQLVEVLACQGIEAEVTGNDAAAIVRIKDGVGNYGFVCSSAPEMGQGGGTLLEWVRTRCPGAPVTLVPGAGKDSCFFETRQRGTVAVFHGACPWEVQQALAEVLPYL